LFLNHLDHTLIRMVKFGGLAQQLRGVADRAEWIADLVRDTRRKAA
jgi:hypothetical protein